VIVVDANVLADALVDRSPRGGDARGRLSGQDLAAPALVDAEVLSVLRKLVAHSRLKASEAGSAVDQLARVRLRRVGLDGLTRRMWQLRQNLAPYDAAYVALAEELGVPLLTADKRIAAAPKLRCEVHVLD
jgi:predicted nucleic acid-binding protein